MAENPYAWDYDYKKHYFEAFEKFGVCKYTG